jgi:alpha-ribazole phosphatase/probable phosphoglycerate mutase
MSELSEVTTLYLIRHGHTEGDEKRYKGQIDVELSERGQGQIQSLSERLQMLNGSPRAIYCSDLKRAHRSAEILGASLHLSPVVLTDLRERSFGKWEGMSFDAISQDFPDEFGRWKTNPLRFSPPGGESTKEVCKRVLRIVLELIDRHRRETLIVVSHGGVNRVLLAHFMGIPLEHIFRIEQHYGCLNIIKVTGDGDPRIDLLNGVMYEC